MKKSIRHKDANYPTPTPLELRHLSNCNTYLGPSLPPKIQGDIIGSLTLRIGLYNLLENLRYSKFVTFLSYHGLELHSKLNDENLQEGIKKLDNDFDANFCKYVSRHISVRCSFWGDDSIVKIAPYKIMYSSSNTVESNDKTNIDQIENNSNSDKISSIEFPLLGCVDGLRRYFKDMGELPIVITLERDSFIDSSNEYIKCEQKFDGRDEIVLGTVYLPLEPPTTPSLCVSSLSQSLSFSSHSTLPIITEELFQGNIEIETKFQIYKNTFLPKEKEKLSKVKEDHKRPKYISLMEANESEKRIDRNECKKIEKDGLMTKTHDRNTSTQKMSNPPPKNSKVEKGALLRDILNESYQLKKALDASIDEQEVLESAAIEYDDDDDDSYESDNTSQIKLRDFQRSSKDDTQFRSLQDCHYGVDDDSDSYYGTNDNPKKDDYYNDNDDPDEIMLSAILSSVSSPTYSPSKSSFECYPSLAAIDKERSIRLAQVKFARLRIEKITIIAKPPSSSKMNRQHCYSIKYKLPPNCFAATTAETETITNSTRNNFIEIPLRKDRTIPSNFNDDTSTMHDHPTTKHAKHPTRQIKTKTIKTFSSHADKDSYSSIDVYIPSHETIVPLSFPNDDCIRQWLESELCFQLYVTSEKKKNGKKTKNHLSRPTTTIRRSRAIKEKDEEMTIMIASSTMFLKDVLTSTTHDMDVTLELKSLLSSPNNNNNSVESLIKGSLSVRLSLLDGNGNDFIDSSKQPMMRHQSIEGSRYAALSPKRTRRSSAVDKISAQGVNNDDDRHDHHLSQPQDPSSDDFYPHFETTKKRHSLPQNNNNRSTTTTTLLPDISKPSQTLPLTTPSLSSTRVVVSPTLNPSLTSRRLALLLPPLWMHVAAHSIKNLDCSSAIERYLIPSNKNHDESSKDERFREERWSFRQSSLPQHVTSRHVRIRVSSGAAQQVAATETDDNHGRNFEEIIIKPSSFQRRDETTTTTTTDQEKGIVTTIPKMNLVWQTPLNLSSFVVSSSSPTTTTTSSMVIFEIWILPTMTTKSPTASSSSQNDNSANDDAIIGSDNADGNNGCKTNNRRPRSVESSLLRCNEKDKEYLVGLAKVKLQPSSLLLPSFLEERPESIEKRRIPIPIINDWIDVTSPYDGTTVGKIFVTIAVGLRRQIINFFSIENPVAVRRIQHWWRRCCWRHERTMLHVNPRDDERTRNTVDSNIPGNLTETFYSPEGNDDPLHHHHRNNLKIMRCEDDQSCSNDSIGRVLSHHQSNDETTTMCDNDACSSFLTESLSKERVTQKNERFDRVLPIQDASRLTFDSSKPTTTSVVPNGDKKLVISRPSNNMAPLLPKAANNCHFEGKNLIKMFLEIRPEGVCSDLLPCNDDEVFSGGGCFVTYSLPKNDFDVEESPPDENVENHNDTKTTNGHYYGTDYHLWWDATSPLLNGTSRHVYFLPPTYELVDAICSPPRVVSSHYYESSSSKRTNTGGMTFEIHRRRRPSSNEKQILRDRVNNNNQNDGGQFVTISSSRDDVIASGFVPRDKLTFLSQIFLSSRRLGTIQQRIDVPLQYAKSSMTTQSSSSSSSSHHPILQLSISLTVEPKSLSSRRRRQCHASRSCINRYSQECSTSHGMRQSSLHMTVEVHHQKNMAINDNCIPLILADDSNNDVPLCSKDIKTSENNTQSVKMALHTPTTDNNDNDHRHSTITTGHANTVMNENKHKMPLHLETINNQPLISSHHHPDSTPTTPTPPLLPHSDSLTITISISHTQGLRELLSLWYDLHHASKDASSFEPNDLMTSGVIVSFRLQSSSHRCRCDCDDDNEGDYYATKIVILNEREEDTSASWHSFDFCTDVSFPDDATTIEFLRGDKLVMTLWFVPTVTNDIIVRGSARGRSENAVLPKGESYFRVGVAELPFYHLLLSREGCRKRIPWSVLLMDDDGGGGGRENVGYVNVGMQWKTTHLPAVVALSSKYSIQEEETEAMPSSDNSASYYAPPPFEKNVIMEEEINEFIAGPQYLAVKRDSSSIHPFVTNNLISDTTKNDNFLPIGIRNHKNDINDEESMLDMVMKEDAPSEVVQWFKNHFVVKNANDNREWTKGSPNNDKQIRNDDNDDHSDRNEKSATTSTTALLDKNNIESNRDHCNNAIDDDDHISDDSSSSFTSFSSFELELQSHHHAHERTISEVVAEICCWQQQQPSNPVVAVDTADPLSRETETTSGSVIIDPVHHHGGDDEQNDGQLSCQIKVDDECSHHSSFSSSLPNDDFSPISLSKVVASLDDLTMTLNESFSCKREDPLLFSSSSRGMQFQDNTTTTLNDIQNLPIPNNKIGEDDNGHNVISPQNVKSHPDDDENNNRESEKLTESVTTESSPGVLKTTANTGTDDDVISIPLVLPKCNKKTQSSHHHQQHYSQEQQQYFFHSMTAASSVETKSSSPSSLTTVASGARNSSSSSYQKCFHLSSSPMHTTNNNNNSHFTNDGESDRIEKITLMAAAASSVETKSSLSPSSLSYQKFFHSSSSPMHTTNNNNSHFFMNDDDETDRIAKIMGGHLDDD